MHIITVMAASVNGKVVLWEVNPQHPSGEIYISGDGRAVQVALTPAVQQKLDAQMLIKVVTVHDEPAPAVETQPVSDEPVPGYDSMTALAVVELSHALTDDERASVLAYETVHKNRATVLRALQ